MKWDQQVPGCFGIQDLIFAVHPSDEEWAFAWLTDLRKRQIGWKAARNQLEAYLRSKGAGPDRIQEEIDRASTKLKPWLLD